MKNRRRTDYQIDWSHLGQMAGCFALGVAFFAFYFFVGGE